MNLHEAVKLAVLDKDVVGFRMEDGVWVPQKDDTLTLLKDLGVFEADTSKGGD